MPDCDVLVCGAGPAGSIAAAILARRGLRVHLIDRARFPRPKLCGDTVNPGAYACLQRLSLDAGLDAASLPVDGMLVTGEGGVRVEGRYPPGIHGRALTRADLDLRLLERAIVAGAGFDDGVTIREPLARGGRVEGVRAHTGRKLVDIRARLTIAADGRRSTVAIALGLLKHPPRPRRWAIGAYFEGVENLTPLGEMHVRRRHYLGIAPLPGGLANTCLVVEGGDPRLRIRPLAAIRSTIESDAALAPRFADARDAGDAIVLGPLAVDASAAGLPGLLLAGDAAGFIDPMTGDGLRFAFVGAELAAEAAIGALTLGRRNPEQDLARARARAFAGKCRFNRVLRSLVASPRAVHAAGIGARVAPQAIAQLVRIAGDVSA